MVKEIYIDPTKRHDFVLLFDVTDGNPNGDPDAGNLPRVDPETMQGMVTDVCLKRKVRNWIDITNGSDATRKIYVQNKIALNDLHQRAYNELKLKSTGSKQKRDDVEKTRKWMCENFYDIRMFGAVMTTGVNCGQVRGPVQMTFARSINPVVPLDVAITRIAITRTEDAKVVESESDAEGGGKTTEMGRKALLPYGLYKGVGFFSPHFAQDTRVNEEDLSLFWQALQQMWDLDHSASRGLMACRGLYIFSHDKDLGNAPAHTLFDRLTVKLNDGIEAPRQFGDYTITVQEDSLPEGVTLTQLVG